MRLKMAEYLDLTHSSCYPKPNPPHKKLAMVSVCF